MRQFEPLVKRALLTSLAPLLFYALISLFEYLLTSSLWNREETQNTLHENHQGFSYGSQLANLLFSLVIQAKALILHAYSSLFNFTLMMILLNLIDLMGGWFQIIKFHEDNDKSSLSKNTLPSWPEESQFTTLKSPKNISKIIISYFTIYYCCSSALNFLYPLNSPPISDNGLLSSIQSRFLETSSSAVYDYLSLQGPNPSLSQDIRTLSIGKILSSLNINPDSIILSRDNKLAYVITKTYGGLKIIDISDSQYPIILSSLDLAAFDYFAAYKGLLLSANGETLFATNCQTFEVIDVSNPQAPRLIHSSKDSLLSGPSHDPGYVPSFYLPTLALSPDETILYMAGIGLEIRNITDLSNPKPIFSKLSTIFNNRYRVTSLALLPDSKTLLFGNGTLDILDVSDPTKPRTLNVYPADISISSIALTKNSKIVYAAGFEANSQVMLQKIDISDFTSPRSIALYDLEVTSLYPPNIKALSLNETNIFIGISLVDDGRNYYRYADLIGFDLLKERTMIQAKDLFSSTNAIVMIPNTSLLLAGSKDQFKVIQLYKNFPNTKNFCWFNNTNTTVQFPSQMKYVQPLLGYPGNIVLAVSFTNKFRIYNISNPRSPQELSYFDLELVNLNLDNMFLSQNIAAFSTGRGLLALDISDISSIKSLGFVTPSSADAISAFTLSPKDNKIAFLLKQDDAHNFCLRVLDFKNPSKVIETTFANLASFPESPSLTHSHDGNTLFFSYNGTISSYNVSTPTKPVFISSQPVTTPSEPRVRILSITFSKDSKTLFALIYEASMLYSLRIIDISNLAKLKTLKTFSLPKTDNQPAIRPFTLSKDMKRGFVHTDEDILIIDLQNLTNPAILGMIPIEISFSTYDGISHFFLSQDEKTASILTLQGDLIQFNIEVPYSLFIPQGNLLLGQKYTDNLMFLRSKDSSDFLLMDPSEYKIIKLSLFDIQIIPSDPSLFISSNSLPSWMTYDPENQIISIEPKRQRELGSYTLHSVSSKKVPLQAFSSILPNTTQSQDLFAWLISLGYLDNQRFLTSSLGSYKDLFLPSPYSEYMDQIYQILKSYRIETLTGFNILPSLQLSTTNENKLSISTTSSNSIKIDVKLYNRGGEFLKKSYSLLKPVITEDKSRLIIEGPLDLVNKALQGLVINLNNTNSSCDGEITINDNLNPPISQVYKNISDYFFKNGVPMLNTSHNLTVQQQIDTVSLYTGQYFSINLDPYTFKDQYSDSLTFILVKREDNKDDESLPSWLSSQGLTLKGTPPEEIFKRQFKFGLIIKNEFKQIEIPLTLNVKISWLFAGKLLLRNSPYILTVIGLLVSANKIYNILAKKRYRHAKEFYLRTGEEINSSIVFPIRFIAEEKLEGDLILKHLNKRFTVFLLDDEAEIKGLIKDAINDMPRKDRRKLRLYTRGPVLGQKRVYQYVRNEMIMQQLDLSREEATMNLFNNLKDKWPEFIEYNDVCGFTVNDNNLNSLLGEKQKDNPLSESLLNHQDVNNDLLKKALVVYATKKHELNIFDLEVDVQVKVQRPASALFQFIKYDLNKINYSDKGQIGYGLKYHVKKNTLEVLGTPDENFEGKTLVIQVVNLQQRILKEIWIYGVSNVDNNESQSSFYSLNESQARGKGYEII